MALTRLADAARLLYCDYPEQAAELARLNHEYERAQRALCRSPDDAIIRGNAVYFEARRQRVSNVCEEYAKQVGDLALAVAKELPGLWSDLRLVRLGACWHTESGFAWAAGGAELRRIEAAALNAPALNAPDEPSMATAAPIVKGDGTRQTCNDRMMAQFTRDRRCVDWSLGVWSKQIGFSRSTIQSQPTWRAILAERERLRQEHRERLRQEHSRCQ